MLEMFLLIAQTCCCCCCALCPAHTFPHLLPSCSYMSDIFVAVARRNFFVSHIEMALHAVQSRMAKVGRRGGKEEGGGARSTEPDGLGGEEGGGARSTEPDGLGGGGVEGRRERVGHHDLATSLFTPPHILRLPSPRSLMPWLHRAWPPHSPTCLMRAL